MNWTALAGEIHRDNVAAGWWDEWPVKHKRHETAMGLVMTEFAEAIEGARKNLQDDHLPQYSMFHVEIADAAIRLLDLAGAYEIIDLDTGIKSAQPAVDDYVAEAQNPIAACWQVVHWCAGWINRNDMVINALAGCFALADRYGIPLLVVIEAKRAYNKTRKDHSREERAKPGGKKF